MKGERPQRSAYPSIPYYVIHPFPNQSHAQMGAICGKPGHSWPLLFWAKVLGGLARVPTIGLGHGTGPTQKLHPEALKVFSQTLWGLSHSPPSMPTLFLVTHEAYTLMKPWGYGLVMSRGQNLQETLPIQSPTSHRDGAELRRKERLCPT